jgi:hypothetical protein
MAYRLIIMFRRWSKNETSRSLRLCDNLPQGFRRQRENCRRRVFLTSRQILKKSCGFGLTILVFRRLTHRVVIGIARNLFLPQKNSAGIGRSTFVFSHNVFDYFIEAQPQGEESFMPVMRGEFKKSAQIKT